MAFIDEITIDVEAGNGGDGVVRWLHEKGKEFGGPSGGNGGNGGNVYAKAVRDVHLLTKYKHKKVFSAQHGEPGAKNALFGKHGDDLTIELPVGSIITNTKTGWKESLLKEGDEVLLLKGGKGGRGNKSFKSSTNINPQECTPGEEGEKAEFFIEVELIADVGFIGLPSAGKTSLLNALTNAKGKVGAYPFTTLEPNLGEMYGYILSDIPGLIEGAAGGKGLGHKFLRHVRRTKMLVHLISVENEDVVYAYKAIRKELEQFDAALMEKPEMVVLTKIDIISDEKKEELVKKLGDVAREVKTLTLLDDDGVKEFQDSLIKKLSEQS